MSALRAAFMAVADTVTPNTTMARIRFRSALDMLLTLVIAVIAVGLAVGYQVVGRWARRSAASD